MGIYCLYIRNRLSNRNGFTIISNNCLGGSVYEDLGFQKSKPAVDLFLLLLVVLSCNEV